MYFRVLVLYMFGASIGTFLSACSSTNCFSENEHFILDQVLLLAIVYFFLLLSCMAKLFWSYIDILCYSERFFAKRHRWDLYSNT